MVNSRRLPEDNQQRLNRLLRDNWRTQVSTAPALAVPDVPGAPPELGADVSWGEVLDRLDVLEQRMNNLEGVEESG